MMQMAQHFLLSAASRALKLKDIYQAGENRAYETFCKLRWPETDGEAVCPHCGCCDAYFLKSRRRYKCAACRQQFSVTSGTILHSRKLSFTDLLAAMCILAKAAKGVSSLQLARELGIHAKSAWVLAHKLREAIGAEARDIKLDDEVAIDGCYVGGSIPDRNLKANRVDRRLKRYQTGKRRVVIAIREGKERTITTVAKNEAEGVEFAKARLLPGTIVNADEASQWDMLNALFPTERINHSEAYSLNGVHTNFVESYFSRLRRMVGGQHHWVSPQHLHQYAAHAAWLEDHRRSTNGALAGRILRNALASPVSRTFSGRWQKAA